MLSVSRGVNAWPARWFTLTNGKLKVISFYAKKARWKMVNFIIKNKLTSYEELKLFKNNGYSFSHESNGEILFYRWF